MKKTILLLPILMLFAMLAQAQAPTNNQIITIVNGRATSAITIIDSVRLSLNPSTELIVAVNGVPSPAFQVIGLNQLTFSAPNQLNSNINGVVSSQFIIHSVLDSTSANQHFFRVNGQLAGPANMINTTVMTRPTGNTVGTTINGVAATADATIIDSNNLSSTANTMRSSVNGQASTAPIINTSSVTRPSGNTVGTTINGVNGTAATIIDSNNLGSTMNTMRSSVNGQASTAPIVNSISNTNTGFNAIRTTVNGVMGDTVALVNSNTVALNRSTGLQTWVNGVASTQTIPSGTIKWVAGFDSATGNPVNQSVAGVLAGSTTNVIGTSGNIITSTVNGVSDTTTTINSIMNTSTANNLSTTVNGVAGSTVTMINTTVMTRPSGNSVGTTINGVAATVDATIIDSNNLGSTANTMRSSVNGQASTAPIINTSSVTRPSGNTVGTTINGVNGTAATIIDSNNLSSTMNTMRSSVNGQASTAPIVNTSDMTRPTGNTIGHTINGVTVSTTAVIIDSNNLGSTANTMRSSVNGQAMTAPIVNTTVMTRPTGNSVGTTINGVAATVDATIIDSNNLGSTMNTMRSSVNGQASTAPIVNSISNTNTGFNAIRTTVNGVMGDTVALVNSNTVALNRSTGLQTWVNGVASTQTIPSGTIKWVAGFDSATGNPVNQSVAGVLAGSTTNVIGTSGNIITSTVNGVSDTTTTINSIMNTSTANNLSTTVNGVAGSTVTMINTTVMTRPSGNSVGTTINGVAATVDATIIDSNNLGSTANTMRSSVNGQASTAPIINTSSVTRPSGNTVGTTINGVNGTAATIIDSNNLSSTMNTMRSSVNGQASTAPIVNTSDMTRPTGNTIGHTINGVTVSTTAVIIDSNNLGSTANTMRSSVNGQAMTAPIVNTTVMTRPTGNSVGTTINGVAATIDATIIDSNNLGSTMNTMRSSVNGQASTAPIVNSISNTNTGFNAIRTTVNGVMGDTVALVNSNTVALNRSTGLQTWVNGVSSTQTIPSGTIKWVVGFDSATGNPVNQSLAGVLSGATTNVLSSAGNIITSTVNGTADTTLSVKSVSTRTSTVTNNHIMATINGVASADSAQIVNSLSNAITSNAGVTFNGLRTTVNGVQSNVVNLVSTFAGTRPATNQITLNINGGKTVTIKPIDTTTGNTPKLILGGSGRDIKVSVNGVVSPDSITLNFAKSNCSTYGRVPRVTTSGMTDIGCGTIYDSANSVWIGAGTVPGGSFDYTAQDVLGAGGGGVGAGVSNQNGTYKLWVDGDVASTGYISTSDKNLKTDIQAISNPNEIILGLEGKTYKWNDEFRQASGADGGTQYGFLAQDMAKVFPSAVVKAQSGRFGVKYNAVIPVLVESQKALIKENESLRSEMKEMKDRLYAIEKYLSENGAKAIPTIKDPIVLSSEKDMLFDATPNPTSGNATIAYSLSKVYTSAEIRFFEPEGKAIQTVKLDAKKGAGSINISFGDLPSQIYLFSLVVDGQVVDTKKIQVAK